MFQKLKQFISQFQNQPVQDPVEKALNLPKSRKPLPDTAPSITFDHPCESYRELQILFRNAGRMKAIVETLGRDFLTAMPDGAYLSRLGQIAFLYQRLHADLSDSKIIPLLEESINHTKTNPEDWDEWNLANLREIDFIIRFLIGIPADLIEKKARLSYEGRHVHRDVLKNNDWDSAKTFLEGMVELQQRIADHRLENSGEQTDRYQTLITEYMPGTKLQQIDELFSAYKQDLETILPQILTAQSNRPDPLEMDGVFSGKSQMWLNRALLKSIGFDFERGGLYETGHNPVEGGTPDDTRLVIKTVKIGTFLDSMKSALHEGGHGIYIQGLPRKQWRYQPVGQDLGAMVHESQALLIEMILGRKREFFEFLAPRSEGVFQRFGDEALSAENLWRLKNQVGKTLDRKSADEVTYFLHIHMRTELEKKLINGDLVVADLPDAWAQYTRDLFGSKPKSNLEGCLQDVHWFVGKFGYFPSYAMGHMMAAQIYETMLRDIPHIPAQLRQGDFNKIHEWLYEKIYQKGRLLTSNDLIKDITGEALSHHALVRHIKNRYLGS